MYYMRSIYMHRCPCMCPTGKTINIVYAIDLQREIFLSCLCIAKNVFICRRNYVHVREYQFKSRKKLLLYILAYTFCVLRHTYIHISKNALVVQGALGTCIQVQDIILNGGEKYKLRIQQNVVCMYVQIHTLLSTYCVCNVCMHDAGDICLRETSTGGNEFSEKNGTISDVFPFPVSCAPLRRASWKLNSLLIIVWSAALKDIVYRCIHTYIHT